MQTHPILVVDDSASYRRLLSRTLERLGFEVLEAEDGEAALEALHARHDLGLVVSDWDMPRLDGPGLCTAVRACDFGRYIYLILVTARESSGDLIVGMEAGADDFLTKPVDPNELRVRVRAGQRVLDLEAALAERNRKLIEAHRNIESDLRAAAELQVSMLPPPRIEIDPFVCEWLFVPSAFLSGDMLNVFELDEDHVAFYEIDVAGHGVPAAMLSVMVGRQLAKGRSAGGLLRNGTGGATGARPSGPGDVVAELNRQFQADNPDAAYFTMVYGILNKRTGRGELTQAGHTHPIHVGTGTSASLLGDGGFPVALLPDREYESVSFTLAPGERLYLYSDGVTECAAPDGALFGEQRLVEHVLEYRNRSLTSVLTTLEQALRNWRISDDAFADDVSVLAMERR